MRVIRSRYPDQFLVHKLTDAEIREFAAIAGVFHAAEWQVRRSPGRLVDKDHSGFDLAGDSLPPLDILGDDRSAKPIRRVVRQARSPLFRSSRGR